MENESVYRKVYFIYLRATQKFNYVLDEITKMVLNVMFALKPITDNLIMCNTLEN